MSNLDRLHERLIGNWEPTSPTRIHLPKSSGLLRPLTLLALEDQIVLQAVANKFAAHVRDRRKKVEFRQVLSNCLEKQSDSIFFLQDWQISYHGFQRQLRSHLDLGYRWIAHFDLAAFYETISHRALRSIIAPRGGNPETWSRISHWLCVWSAGRDGVQVDHGIPQGPIASDFLAEIFMLPIDEDMKGQSVRYIRYVDDIRVLAKTEKEARRSAISLDLACRKWSLIPQSSKFVVSHASSIEDALGTLPSIIESANPREEDPYLDSTDALRILGEALKGRPLKVVDKTRLRYVLYRASPANKILRRLLDLMPRHPEHVDAFMAYLSQYAHSSFIMDRAREMLRGGVLYEYVEGEIWRLIADIGRPVDLRRLVGLFKRRSRDKGLSMPLQWGLLAFAAASARAGVISRSALTRRVTVSEPYLQSLVVPFLDEREFRSQGLAGKLLRQQHAEPGLALVPRLMDRNLSHRSFGIRPNQLAFQVRSALHGVGLLPSKPNDKFDQIGDLLRVRYNINYWRKWRSIFGTEFVHAKSMLLSADAKYASSPSEWLSLQDSFNDALFRSMQRHMMRLNIPGNCRLTNTYGKLLDYGSLLDPNKHFSTTLPAIAVPLRTAHVRRNSLPTSHPYEKKTAMQTKYLTGLERNRIAADLARAYTEIIALLDGYL